MRKKQEQQMQRSHPGTSAKSEINDRRVTSADRHGVGRVSTTLLPLWADMLREFAQHLSRQLLPLKGFQVRG